MDKIGNIRMVVGGRGVCAVVKVHTGHSSLDVKGEGSILDTVLGLESVLGIGVSFGIRRWTQRMRLGLRGVRLCVSLRYLH